MSRSCEEHRADLMAHLAGDLAALEHARLEAHLAHCADCTALRRVLALGLAAARDVPSPTDAEIERLIQQAQPTTAVSRIRPPLRLLGLVVPLAAAAALAFVVIGTPPPQPPPLPGPVAGLLPPARFSGLVPGGPVDAGPVVLPASGPEPVEAQPSAYVRLVHDGGYRGAVAERRAGETVLVVDQGSVAVSFMGGEGRRLRVEAGDVSIDVTGTRFYVARPDAARVIVGVRSGHVEVHVGASTRTLGPAEVLQIEGSAISNHSSDGDAFVWTDRPFLLSGERHADVHVDPQPPGAELSPSSTPQRAGAPLVSASRNDPDGNARAPQHEATAALLALFADAEARTLAGDVDGARSLYRRGVSDPIFGSKRALAEFELGRFLALTDKDPAAARPLLDRLAHGSSNVAGDAALLLCRLDEATDPCASDRCLAKLAAAGGAIGRDAALLRTKFSALRPGGQLQLRCQTPE